MITLALAAEDGTGEWLVHRVTDAHVSAITGIPAGGADAVRRWRQFDGHGWLRIQSVGARAKARFGHHFMGKGHFGGAPGEPDAVVMRKLFQLLASEAAPDIVVVARDLDGTDRKAGFVQASQERKLPFHIVGALAQPETEAWLVAAWSPGNDRERRAHSGLRQSCGFDPVAESHRLTSTSMTKRDAKVVLRELTQERDSARDHFAARSIADWRACGEHNGLREFVDQHGAALGEHLGRVCHGPRSNE